MFVLDFGTKEVMVFLLSAANQCTVCNDDNNANNANNNNHTKRTWWTFGVFQGKYMCYDCTLAPITADLQGWKVMLLLLFHLTTHCSPNTAIKHKLMNMMQQHTLVS